MAEVNIRSWSEISQASEGLQLNSTVATLEHILARFARLETRLVEHERRVAATLPPLQPEPDPPDALQWQQPQQLEMQDWRWQQHHPHTQPVQTRLPTSWDPPDYRQQSGFMPYDQYRLPYHHGEENQPPPSPPCCWDPPAQQSLHGFPPHNQFHNLPLHSVPYGISHPTNHPHQTVSFLEPQPATISDWNPSSLCSATTISLPCSPEFRYGSTELIAVDNGVSIKSCPTTAIHCPPDRVQARVEGGHCDIPERGVSTDSILATEVTKIIDREAVYSHTRNVSNQAIVVTSDISGEEGKLFDDGPPPLSPILQLYIPDVSEEEEDDKEEEDSVGKVKEIIASILVARVPSQDVENCWNKRGGAYTGLKIIVYVDLCVGDVTGELFVLAWNFTNYIGSPLMIFVGGDEGGRSAVRYTFDPGGAAPPTLLLSTLLIASWIPP